MPTKLEQEKKYLIKPISSWEDLSSLLEDLVDIKRISQSYLVADKGEQAARVRKTIEGIGDNKKVVFHYNKKKPLDTGVHKETEREISEKEYKQYLKDSNPSKCEVHKTRFVFKWHDQTFELDLFKGHLKGLAILEIELSDIDMKVNIPPFLTVIKDITSEKKYSNFNLADK
jgi:CYTH domain-containing protein